MQKWGGNVTWFSARPPLPPKGHVVCVRPLRPITAPPYYSTGVDNEFPVSFIFKKWGLVMSPFLRMDCEYEYSNTRNNGQIHFRELVPVRTLFSRAAPLKAAFCRLPTKSVKRLNVRKQTIPSINFTPTDTFPLKGVFCQRFSDS